MASKKSRKKSFFGLIWPGLQGSRLAALKKTIKGTAIWINDSSHENQYRFYAMHKSAPIGSVLMVRNLMNNRVVYAKLIGKLPNNKSNENIVVKLSAGAARYLNVLDDRFVVELSLPQAKL